MGTFKTPPRSKSILDTYKKNHNLVYFTQYAQTFVDCVNGRFGDDCNSICHCKNGPCNKTTGICPAGGCASGYYGDTCSTGKLVDKHLA